MRTAVAALIFAVFSSSAFADVAISDSDSLAAAIRAYANSATLPGHANIMAGHKIKPGEKSHRGVPLSTTGTEATGSISLIDASGLKYFINTNITFSTSSSASGAMSEASYTHAVAATTLNGGTTASTLNDAFDGYNTACLSLNNTVATCETGNANFDIYNKNGAPTLDGTCNNRQVIFPTQTMGSVTVSREVYVPTDDSFGRWLNIVKNTSGTPQTVTLVVANNLGSDNNTVITGSSAGGTVNNSVTWVSTFQNYSGTTTSDPRLGHVLQGAGASVGLAGVSFVNGNDNPYWGYTMTLQPGQTDIIMNFVTGQPSKAAAATQSARLATLPASALECVSATQQSEIVNFVARPAAAVIPTPGPSRRLLVLLTALLAAIGLIGFRLRLR
jgi:hypothetical protein